MTCRRCGRAETHARGLCRRCYLADVCPTSRPPRGLEACACCGKPWGPGTRYRASGLCHRCWRRARVDGTLTAWRVQRAAARTGMETWAVMLGEAIWAVGATEVSLRLGVARSLVFAWHGGVVPGPEQIRGIVRVYVAVVVEREAR